MSTRTRDDDLALIDIGDFTGAVILTDIIGAEDPVRALAKLFILRDSGGDKGQVRARATFRAAGLSAEAAVRETAAIVAEIWPETA